LPRGDGLGTISPDENRIWTSIHAFAARSLCRRRDPVPVRLGGHARDGQGAQGRRSGSALELTLIDGKKVSSAELKGRVIVLNFWATWCGPCKKELPLLDRYYDIQKDHGLSVYAIATEGSLPNSALKQLFAAMRMPSVRSMKGPYHALDGVPTNIVIDRAGVIRYAQAGAFTLMISTGCSCPC
jgi:thiol-disulfide isomerase/thioredoxin